MAELSREPNIYINDANSAEEEAADRLALEQRPEAPDSAEKLVAATFDSVEKVQSKLMEVAVLQKSRKNYDHAFQLTLIIEQRVRRYLCEEQSNKPSPNALSLMHAETPDYQEIRYYIISELNPLLHELAQAVKKLQPVPKDIATEQGLLLELSVGTIKGQATHSLFSMLEGISAAEPHMPRRIIVEDPLSNDAENKKYWTERGKCHEVYGKTTAEGIIAVRSMTAAYELDDYAKQAEQSHQRKLAEAYKTLSTYIEEQTQSLNEDFGRTAIHLNFAHGQADDIFAVLNAAEIIKVNNPQLYARLLGIAPSYGPTTEAQRSDLFGNAFQIAVYRSQHLSLMKEDTIDTLAGRQVLRERIKGLTDFDAHQLPLQHINMRQMRELKNRVVAESAAEEKNPILIRMLLMMAAKGSTEYALQNLLDSVSLVERDENIERLKTCAPQEFIKILRNMPEAMAEDAEVQRVVAERIPLCITKEKIIAAVMPVLEEVRRHQQHDDRDLNLQNIINRIQRSPQRTILVENPLFKAITNTQIFWEIDSHWYQKDPDSYDKKSNAEIANIIADELTDVRAEDGDLGSEFVAALPRRERLIFPGSRIIIVDKRSYTMHPQNTINAIRDVEIDSELMFNLEMQLWETASDEEMLSLAFFKSLEKLPVNYDKLRKRANKEGEAFDVEEVWEQLVGQVLDATGAHPNITDEQWLEWYHQMPGKLQETSAWYQRGKKLDFSGIVDMRQERVDTTLDNILSRLTLEITEKGRPSRFTALGSVLPSNKTEADQRNLRTWNTHLSGRADNAELVRKKRCVYRWRNFADKTLDKYQPDKIYTEREFIFSLDPIEARNFLNRDISDFAEGKKGDLHFDEINPWQLELLQLAEELIPDNPVYQKLKAEISDEKHIDRYGQNADGRWHVDIYDAESGSYKRFINWDKMKQRQWTYSDGSSWRDRVARRKLPGQVPLAEGPITAMEIAPDGCIVFSDQPGRIKVVDPKTRALKIQFNLSDRPIIQIGINDDGKITYISSDDGYGNSAGVIEETKTVFSYNEQ